jgi:ATP-dependent Clp protease ATP-binding subunit ClpC
MEPERTRKMTTYGLSSSVGRLLNWISSSLDRDGKRNNAHMNERDRFDRFTRRARKVLTLAQAEAQRLRHNAIGTEHLLLGLIREGDGVAAKVLIDSGIDLEKVRKAIEDTLGRGDHIIIGEIGLTPDAKKVIELAVDEARLLNHHYIGTEHLLLGLLREGEGKEPGVLEGVGLSVQEVRAKIIEILNKQRK